MGEVGMRDSPELQEALLRHGTPAAAGDYSDWSSEVSDSESDSSSSTVIDSDVALDKPGDLNRTYGVAALASYDLQEKSETLDEQLDALRAVLPRGATRSKERMTMVVDVYHYIATLQRQVEDLKAELRDVDASLHSARTRPDEVYHCESERRASCPRGEPRVDVAKRNGLLEVRIVCANRPGLLVDIMEAIESTGLTILHTSIARHDEIVIEYLNLEMNEETEEAEGEEERLQTMLLHAIHSSRSNWLSTSTTLQTSR